MIIKRRLRQRPQFGSAAVELVAGLVLLIPLALLAVNVCTLGLASFFNDQASKEAARAAAEQTSLVPATQVARAVVKSFAIANGAISSPRIAGVEYTYFDKPDGMPIELADLTTANLAKAPSVQVTTRLTITTPAPFLFSKGQLTNSVVLVSQHAYPLLAGVDPNPAEANDVGDDDNPPPADPADGQSGDDPDV
jgi:hypothetical protein